MPGADDHPWRWKADGLQLRVRLNPKGGRDAIDGLTATAEGQAVKARVRAAPENGEANDALMVLVANWLGVPRRDVILSSGHKSRTKQLAIAGDRQTLEQRLQAALSNMNSDAKDPTR